jgi:hypothetical protein
MLWGRKLPDICQDFEANGIRLDHLYTGLNVPLDWIDQKRWFDAWQSCVHKAVTRFNMNIDSNIIEKAFKKIAARDFIDFGLLNEPFQKTVISIVLSDSKSRNRLVRLNPFLADFGNLSGVESLIQNNQDAVDRNYHQTIYRNKLTDIYAKVANVNVRHKIDKSVLISGFFNLENLSLLKWGPYFEE